MLFSVSNGHLQAIFIAFDNTIRQHAHVANLTGQDYEIH